MATAMNQASTLPLSNLISFSLPKTSSLKTIPFLPLPSKPSKPYNLSLSSTHQKGFFLGSKRTLLVIPHVSTQEEQQGEVLFKEETIEGEGVNWVGGESEGFGDPDGRLGEFEVGNGGGEAAVEEEYVPPPEEAKLFVANLGYDIDSEKLAETFEAAGVVEIAEVIYNRTTGQSRGFGFVTMSTVEEADKAVEILHRYELNGRVLQVNKAAPRGTKVERPPRTIAPEFRVYVGNLPWDLDNEQLKEIFLEHGTVVNARIVFDRETGRSRGFGFVAMSSEAEMQAAIEALNGQSINGRAVIVRVAEDRPRRLF